MCGNNELTNYRDQQIARIAAQSRHWGFSMIELMIVVAIIGFLSMVALPSYSEYITRTNRADAKDMLTDVMFQQERFNTRNRTYTTNMTQLGYGADPVISANGLYSIDGAACQGSNLQTCVILTATPVVGGRQVSDGSLTLDSRGARTPIDKWSK